MIPIQSILVVALALGLYLYLTRLRSTALDRILVVTAAGVVLTFVVAPDLSTVVANRLGVGRGVDLIFYLSHTGVGLVLILLYAKVRRQSVEIAELARALAIREARVPGEGVGAGTEGAGGAEGGIGPDGTPQP